MPTQGNQCRPMLRECLWNWTKNICDHGLWVFERISFAQSKGKCPTQQSPLENPVSEGSPCWPPQHLHMDSTEGPKPRAASSSAFSTNCSGTTKGAPLVWVLERWSCRTVGSPSGSRRSTEDSEISLSHVFEKQPHPESMGWTLWS